MPNMKTCYCVQKHETLTERLELCKYTRIRHDNKTALASYSSHSRLLDKYVLMNPSSYVSTWPDHLNKLWQMFVNVWHFVFIFLTCYQIWICFSAFVPLSAFVHIILQISTFSNMVSSIWMHTYDTLTLQLTTLVLTNTVLY